MKEIQHLDSIKTKFDETSRQIDKSRSWRELYHIDASLKDLVKSGLLREQCSKIYDFCCGFSKMDMKLLNILERLENPSDSVH
jgi:hypothetical protein